MIIYGVLETLIPKDRSKYVQLNKKYFFHDKDLAETVCEGLKAKFDKEKDGSCDILWEVVELKVF